MTAGIPIPGGGRLCFSILALVAALVMAGSSLHADQVEMQNGDRYVGNVVSLTGETLVLRSDVLGTVTLPRGKVAQVSFGSAAPTNSSRVAIATNLIVRGATVTNVNALRLPALPKTAEGTNVMQQVQQQLLADATPEARAKFTDLASGYLSGQVSVNDIRVEAQAAVKQLKSLKAGLGEEADSSLDGYLAILEGFLNETASTSGKTNAPSTPVKPALAR